MADDKVPDEIQREEDGMELEIEGRLRWGTGMGAKGGRGAEGPKLEVEMKSHFWLNTRP